MILYLYPKLNYQNRKIAKYETLDDYDAALGYPYMCPGISFIVGDGIRTEQVINYKQDAPAGYAVGSAAPSYCVITDDSGENIVSRWWIVESTLMCKGQARLRLLRDVIADYYDIVMNSPSFIKKGWLTTPNDTAIFNNEDMTFNQIKKSENLLKDKSKCPWYVGYISKDATTTNDDPVRVPKEEENYYTEYNSWSEYEYFSWTNQYIGPKLNQIANITSFSTNLFLYKVRAARPNLVYQLAWDNNGNFVNPVPETRDFIQQSTTGLCIAENLGENIGMKIEANVNDGQFVSTFMPVMGNYTRLNGNWINRAQPLTRHINADLAQRLLGEDGKVFKIGTDLWRISAQRRHISQYTHVDNSNEFAQLVMGLAQNVPGFDISDDTSTLRGKAVEIQMSGEVIDLVATKLAPDTVDIQIPTNRIATSNAPYDIIAIPAASILKGDKTTSTNLSKRLVSAIITRFKGTADTTLLFDFQLLPYAPFPDEAFMDTGDDNIGQLYDNYFINLNTKTTITEVSTGDEYTFILYAENGDFSKTIYTNTIDVPANSLDYKVANECDVYRLCSPNYNGQFEFSATKNGGVRGWNISGSYKPYSPYVKVSPIFGRLYGQDFGDARGLICGGDFSISQTSEAWTSYELANKNYQVMFDRQITNMERNNAIQRQLDYYNTLTGSLQGGMSGAMAGGMIGGLWGGVAGLAIGGGVSTWGGIKDMQFNEEIRQEQLSFAKDQFGYQLQNIQAMPYSLTKVGSQNVDYKLFPFVEYYTCSDIEKETLINKLKWNGMTIMRISTPNSFINPEHNGIGTFIQARPIRLENEAFAESGEVISAIIRELETGVYVI